MSATLSPPCPAGVCRAAIKLRSGARLFQRGRRVRRPARAQGLLGRIGQPYQHGFGEGQAKELQPDRHALGALPSGAENPAGITMAGNPVADASTPLRSAWVSPTGTTRRRWCGNASASSRCRAIRSCSRWRNACWRCRRSRYSPSRSLSAAAVARVPATLGWTEPAAMMSCIDRTATPGAAPPGRHRDRAPSRSGAQAWTPAAHPG